MKHILRIIGQEQNRDATVIRDSKHGIIQKYYKEGACSELAINSGCVKIPAVSQIPYLFWKNSKLICIKRIPNLNFFTKINQAVVLNCSNSQPFQFDLITNLTFSKCPISAITNTSIYGQIIPSINFSYTRETDYPMVDIKITEYQFCNIYDKQNISPSKQGQTNYNLQLTTIIYCSYADPRVKVFDQISQDQLVNNNQRIFDIIQALPAYPLPNSDYKYLLGFVNYPSWTYNCRQSQQYNLVKTQSHFNLEKNSSDTKLYLIISFIFVLTCSILITFYYGYRKYTQLKAKHSANLLYQTLNQIQRKKPNVYQYIKKQFSNQLTLFFTKLGIGLIAVALLGSLYQNLSISFNWYKSSQVCTDVYMFSLIEAYMIYFQKQKKNILLSIILISTLLFVDATIFCWRTSKDDLVGKQTVQIFQSSDQHKSDSKSSSSDQNQKSIQILQNSQSENQNQINYIQQQLISDYQKQKQQIKVRRHRRMISIADMTDISEL